MPVTTRLLPAVLCGPVVPFTPPVGPGCGGEVAWGSSTSFGLGALEHMLPISFSCTEHFFLRHILPRFAKKKVVDFKW
jgi:hypothetical protein